MKHPSTFSRLCGVLVILALCVQPALSVAREIATPAADQLVVDGRFAVEGEPFMVAAGGDAVWVATLAGDVVRLDPSSGEIVMTIDPPGHAIDLAIDDDILWVLTPDGGGVRRVVTPGVPGGASYAVAALHLIDTVSGSVVETIPLELHGGGLTVSHGAVWVGAGAWTEDEPGMLLRVDPDSNAISATITIDGSSSRVSSVAASEDGIWAIAHGYSAPDPAVIALVDPETDAVVQSVTLEPGMWAGSTLAAVPGAVWLTSFDIREPQPVATLVRVDAGTGAVTSHEIEGFTHSLAFGNDRLWLADCVAATVTSLDPATGDAMAGPVTVGEPAPEGFDPWTQTLDGLSCPQRPAVSDDAVWVPVPGDDVVVRIRP